MESADFDNKVMMMTNTMAVKKRKRVEEDPLSKDGNRQKRQRQLEDDSGDHFSMTLQLENIRDNRDGWSL